MNAHAKPPVGLEPRPLYGIGTVARLTGLKPDTLRVWERRYGLGASHKSASGRRQYTQSDLEHLQLIAALVNDGARIGEIAASDRKTLELLLAGRGHDHRRVLPAQKPRVLFVGAELCDWLDGHQGCISAVSALLARVNVAEALEQVKVDGPVDMIVVHCPSLSTPQMDGVEALRKQLGASRALVVYQLGNDRWLEELRQRGCVALDFPPESSRLAYELGQLTVERETSRGSSNVGELVSAQARRYDDRQLRAAAKLQSSITCECPRHIANLIRALNEFEDYSTACQVENWQEAAVHAAIYAYTAQARHLMERALGSSLEGHESDYQLQLQQVK
jgi:DNA-binding transcriptional MerR regulator